MITFRPMLQVEISINGKSAWFEATIDSGADVNLAPLEMVKYFQIDLGKFPSEPISGIEQTSPVNSHAVPAKMKFGGHSINTHLCIGGNVPTILLGQKGFFDKLKTVTFKYPRFVEITF